MKHNKITHEGVVEAVADGEIKVKILQTSACAACKVHGLCSAAESKEKVVDVPRQNGHSYKVGDQVVVSMSAGDGRDAVVLAFIIPFFLMVVVLIACLYVTKDEGKAAIAGLASLIPYYFLLYLFKDRIKRRFAFRMEN